MNCVRFIDIKESEEIINKYKDIITIIDGKKCKNIKDYFEIIYDIFNFPKYNLYSFDAYIDWMRDDYFKSDPIIIMITNESEFLKNEPENKKLIIDIFNCDIIPYWEKYLLENNGIKKSKNFLVYFVKDNI